MTSKAQADGSIRPVRLTDHLEKNVAKTVFYYILLVGTWGDFKSRWKINFGSRLQDRVRHKVCNGADFFFTFSLRFFSMCIFGFCTAAVQIFKVKSDNC